MPEATLPLLSTWQPFYGIIGAAAATLTGLLFVVVTLIARGPESGAHAGVGAFASPNVTHFCAALLVAATLSAPWPVLWFVSLPLGLYGMAGVTYVGLVGWRMHRVSRRMSYQPVLEDWLGQTAFPLVSYIALLVAALLLPGNPVPALFITGAATVLLVFIGIQNAWAILTYLAVERFHSEQKPPDQAETRP
jgi:hypothetical protein